MIISIITNKGLLFVLLLLLAVVGSSSSLVGATSKQQHLRRRRLGDGDNCQTFDATWVVRELANNNPGTSAGITSAYAQVCGKECAPGGIADCCTQPGDDYIGSMYLKESRAGNGGGPTFGDQEEGLIVDGGYSLVDEETGEAHQLLFQGVVKAILHDPPPFGGLNQPFDLAITGGTGKYAGAYGQVRVNGGFSLSGMMGQDPARVTQVTVCGIQDEDDNDNEQ